jgi:peptidoglycan/xylan/chitin deacetylase (PgdA/CDA1 family)
MSSRLRRGMVRGLAALRGHSHAKESSPEGLRDPIVSLTFDDGVASQRLAGELLAARGLAGTFYVPSGSVGREGNLGWDDLRALVAQGHEIGGHTSGHRHLPALTLSEAQREIESDRVALLEHDLDPVTFAYPYGESSPEVESIVREVGYIGARSIGGVVESLPPQNPFRLRAPHSPRSWTTPEHLIALALVGAHEGGWMIVPFHHLEAEGLTTSSYTTEPSQFAEFLDWLVARGVAVVCVRDVLTSAPPTSIQ